MLANEKWTGGYNGGLLVAYHCILLKLCCWWKVLWETLSYYITLLFPNPKKFSSPSINQNINQINLNINIKSNININLNPNIMQLLLRSSISAKIQHGTESAFHPCPLINNPAHTALWCSLPPSLPFPLPLELCWYQACSRHLLQPLHHALAAAALLHPVQLKLPLIVQPQKLDVIPNPNINLN